MEGLGEPVLIVSGLFAYSDCLAFYESFDVIPLVANTRNWSVSLTPLYFGCGFTDFSSLCE